MTPTIKKLFLDVHMGLGHDGLAAIARKGKINLQDLVESDLVMFLNRAGDKMKVLGSQGRVVGYLKMPARNPISIEALQYIPHTFGVEGGFNYNAALKMMLEKKLGFLAKV